MKILKWSEVRKAYPDQFVKLKVLSSYVKNNQEFIEEMAVVKSIPDELTRKGLLNSKRDEFVYYTSHKNIVLEIRESAGLRKFEVHENKV